MKFEYCMLHRNVQQNRWTFISDSCEFFKWLPRSLEPLSKPSFRASYRSVWNRSIRSWPRFVIQKSSWTSSFQLICDVCINHHHHHIRFNVRDPKTHTVFQASALARVGPPVIFLQAQRSCAISSFIPIAFMSLLTQLLHVFLGAPLSTTPITFILCISSPNYSPPFAQHAQTILTFLSVSCSQHIQCPNGQEFIAALSIF